MITILKKELADYFTSIRCLVLFLLVMLASAGALYASLQGIRSSNTSAEFVFLKLYITSGESIPSFVSFVPLFVAIIGITLGFDAINSERSRGTLIRILSQPVYRDSIINGKFLAGIITLSIMMGTAMLVIAGYGLRAIGVPPSAEEIVRLFIYYISTIVYGGFWLSLSILFSLLFRRIAISLLSSIALWLFFSFFWVDLIVPAIASTTESLLILQRISPSTLFGEITTVLLLPVWRGAGLLTAGEELSYMIANPLSLGQSLLLIWPHLTALLSLTAICFGISYIIFMKQEIRP